MQKIQSLANTSEDGGFTRANYAWIKVLKKFGITRRLFDVEYLMIQKLCKKYGEKTVRVAMLGQTLEHHTDKFNPGDHLTLQRVEKHFDKLVNLGTRYIEREKKIIEDNQRRAEEAKREAELPVNPEVIEFFRTFKMKQG